MTNLAELYQELPNSELFSASKLSAEDMISASSDETLHRFFCFRSNSCTFHFDDGTVTTPAEGSVYYLAPHVGYQLKAEKSLAFVDCVVCSGSLADSFASACEAGSSHFSARPLAMDAFNNILNRLGSSDATPEETNRLAIAFYQLFVELIYSQSHVVESKPALIAQKIRQYIESNIDSDISVTSISKQFYLSETHVIRIFREKYGVTPKQFILNEKINASKILLLDTSLQIKEIAMNFHFADSYHFSHTFKRFTGISPEKYRNKEEK